MSPEFHIYYFDYVHHNQYHPSNIRPDVIEEVEADAQPTVQAPALLTLATAAAPTYNGGRGAAAEVSGIGIFLKKRAQPATTQPNATVTAAAQPDDPREQQRHTVAGAGLDSMEDMSMGDLSFNVDLASKNEGNAIPASTTVDFVDDHREQQRHIEAGTGVNSMEDGSILSRFVDITSKNADNDIPAGTALESVGAGGHILGENVGSRNSDFPSTIRTSDDDVDDIDDDLTEATASNFAAQEDGDVRSKTSSYFSKPSNDQTAAQSAQQSLANDVIRRNTPMQPSNCNARPPREDTAIPGIAYATTVQQPSSRFWAAKTGASKESSMPRWSMETSEPTKKRGNGGVLGPNQGSVPRVSLSPHPGMNVEKRGSRGVLSPNQGSAPRESFSPNPGMNVGNRASSRPGLNAANQARLFSPIGDADDDADDDNSIVIPGAPGAVAHQDANTGTVIQTEVGGVPFDTIKNPPRNPPTSTAGKFSTSLLNRQRSSMISSKNGIAKFSTSAEKVQFAAPANRASATKIVGRSSAPLSKVTTAASSSTAITPDHRRSGAKESAVTPFSRSTNAGGGDNNTPATHETPAMAAQALAGTTQCDFTHSDRIVPELPSVTAGPKTMEVEPQVEEPIRARRPRSNTIYSPPPLTNTESVTPKASNTNPSFPSVDTNDESGQSFPTSTSAFHKDENFDELLSQFVNDIQEGTDIFERGQNDLLELEVDLSHAFAAVLRYKDDYTNLLGEIEGVMAMAECIMSEVTSEHNS